MLLKQTQQISSRTQLTSDNYYDRDTDLQYQSATLFKSYLKCEAETQAELSGEWKPERDNKALLVGNYLHSYFESQEAHEAFIENHQGELLSSRGKTKGKLKSDYQAADAMIDTLANDKGFCQLYQGEKEAIVTGEIFNVEWKGKIDCLDLDHKRFFDLKTSQDIHKSFWNSEAREKESFVAAYNYQLQMYVYRELIYQTFGIWCEPYIIAVSKQQYPDKAIISIPDYRLQEAEELIAERQERVESVRRGEIEPHRCELCDYCRATKKLNEIVSMDELIG